LYLASGVGIETTRVFDGINKMLRLRTTLKKRQRPRIALSNPTAAGRNPARSFPGEAIKASVGKPPASADQVRERSTLQTVKDFLSDLISIPDKEVNWLPHALARAISLHRRKRFDLVYSTAPPFTDHLIACCLKKVTGLPWIADFRDPWARAPWKAEILQGTFRGKAIARLERLFVKTADRVILNTDWIHREFSEYYGDPLAQKFTVLPNGFDPRDFDGNHQPARPHQKLVITHTGALYRKRNPQSFLTACENLLSRNCISPEDLEIRFVGGVAPELYRSFECSQALQQAITVIPPVSHREALNHQQESDVLLIVQPGTSVSVPGKIFEYIGMRKTILALTPAGATADIVRRERLGLVVDPDDIAGIESSLLELLHHFRNGGLQNPEADHAFAKYNGVELARQLHREFLECVHHAKPR